MGEGLRLARGLATLPLIARNWNALPRGRGEPVLVIPGFMTGDGSTRLLRVFLRRMGYSVAGWGLGRNRGNVTKLAPLVVERTCALAAQQGRLHLIGWSLGGVLARLTAQEVPQSVRSVVTLGTPVVGGPKYTITAPSYAKRGLDLDAIERQVAERNARRVCAPITAIYSKVDGVVSWPACLDPNPANDTEHIEVNVGHAEMGFNRIVFEHVARALASSHG